MMRPVSLVPCKDTCWKVDDFPLEMSLGSPELLSGLDTASPSCLHMGGMGSPDIPEGPHPTRNRARGTRRLIFRYYEWKPAWVQLGTQENLKIQISSWFCSSFSL